MQVGDIFRVDWEEELDKYLALLSKYHISGKPDGIEEAKVKEFFSNGTFKVCWKTTTGQGYNSYNTTFTITGIKLTRAEELKELSINI